MGNPSNNQQKVLILLLLYLSKFTNQQIGCYANLFNNSTEKLIGKLLTTTMITIVPFCIDNHSAAACHTRIVMSKYFLLTLLSCRMFVAKSLHTPENKPKY